MKMDATHGGAVLDFHHAAERDHRHARGHCRDVWRARALQCLDFLPQRAGRPLYKISIRHLRAAAAVSRTGGVHLVEPIR